MRWTWREWIEEKGFMPEDVELIEEIVADSDSLVAEVSKGYQTEECVAQACFNKEDRCCYAALKIWNEFYILQEDLNDPVSEWKVYLDKIEAMEALNELENSLFSSIEEQVRLFKENLLAMDQILAARIDIEAKKEFNNDGHWYSFNIYYREMLLLDGVFELDATKCQLLAKEYESLTRELKLHGIFLEGIEKQVIGFERFYHFEFESEVAGEFRTIFKDVSLRYCIQGMPRSTVPFLKDLIEKVKSEYRTMKETAC